MADTCSQPQHACGRRLNESLVSEIQKRGIAIPSLYAIGEKSCVRVCNLNQRSQRSDFEALVQACEQLGVALEARTGHKRSAREDPQGCGTTMMMGTGQELLKRSPDE